MQKSNKYSLGAKFGYATGDILGGGAFALISLLFLNFLVTIEGIPAFLAGIIVMIGKLWDAVSDPIMGILSDRTKSKLGRRRIYLLAGAFPVFLSFSMLWYGFGFENVWSKFAYFTVAYILFSTAFTIVMVPYNALLPDMVNSYKDRTGFSSIRMLISNLAALISVVLPGILLREKTEYHYLKVGILFALFYSVPLVITFFTTWEMKSEEVALGDFKVMLKQLASSFQNKAYRQYIGIFVCGQMATDFITTLMVFWLADIVRRAGILSLTSGIGMLVAVLLLPFNNYLAKKYGKHVPAIVEQPFRIIGLAIAFVLTPSTGMGLILLVCILGGIGGSASAFVPWSLLPDLPDSDEMISGYRNAGTYAGVSTFIRKFTSGFAIFFIGLALEWFGYVESVSGEVMIQTESALLGIRILFSVAPILLSIITMVLAINYTLTIKHHELIRIAIDTKHATGVPSEDRSVIDACEKVSGREYSTMWVGRCK